MHDLHANACNGLTAGWQGNWNLLQVQIICISYANTKRKPISVADAQQLMKSTDTPTKKNEEKMAAAAVDNSWEGTR